MTVTPPTPPSKFVPAHLRVLVGEDDAAALLSVSKPTFRRWVAQGLVARVELPGAIRRNLYRRADLEVLAASLKASQ